MVTRSPITLSRYCLWTIHFAFLVAAKEVSGYRDSSIQA